MKRQIIITLACAALLSCAPPFNKDLSTSAHILDFLTPVGNLVGPIGGEIWETDIVQAKFMPEKSSTAIDATRGLVLFSRGTEKTIFFFRPNGTGGYSMAGFGVPGELTQDTTYPQMQLTTIKTGDYAMILRLAVSPTPSVSDVISIIYPDYTTTNTMASFGPYAIGSSITGFASDSDRCLGASIYPATSASELLYWLVRDAAGSFWELSSTVQGGSPPTISGGTSLNLTGWNLSSFLPAGTVERCLYYHDGDPSRPPNYSYANIHSDTAGWATWKFTDPGTTAPLQLTGITRRIDALLTTGSLFSTQDQIGTVYSADGVELTHFALGNLEFCFEAYDGTVAKVYFSQLLIMDRRMNFRVYSIPTSELDTVK
jgi:hypothetical protein